MFGAVGLAWTLWWERLMGSIALQEPEAAKMLLEGRPDEAGTTDSSVPWRAFMRNGPVQALAVTHFTNNWCALKMPVQGLFCRGSLSIKR